MKERKLTPMPDEKYDKIFPPGCIRKEALKTALDTRKFEIELYWKRATYFWAFITSAFAGYWALMASENFCQYRILTSLIALVGFCFSLGWYFANRGSKYWQENWEKHVKKLEREVQGPLFDILLIPEEFYPFHKNFAFSVSKINTILSIIVTVVWSLLFIISIFHAELGSILGSIQKVIECHPLFVLVISLVFLFVIAVKMFCWSRSSFVDEKSKDEFF